MVFKLLKRESIAAAGTGQVLPDTPPMLSPEVIPTIKERVHFPPQEILLGVRPSDLIRAREEYGREYLRTVQEWQVQPTITNAAKVSDELHRYSKELLKWAGGEQKGLLDVTLAALSNPTRALLLSLLTIEAAELRKYYPGQISLAAQLIALSAGAYAVYKWVNQAPDEEEIEIRAVGSKRASLPEVNFPRGGADEATSASEKSTEIEKPQS